MNEEQKNIETCLPESILAEVASVPTDPQFRSLVEESFDPLKQQAAEQAGWDAYVKVAGTHQPYTFTSSVKQMKSNLILLLRRLWSFPFGRGTIRSLSDMWQHYIIRLKGNPEYGIPSRLDQLTDLPSAPLLVSDRKISGVPEAADGMSLVHLLCGSYADITELTDTNYGYTSSRNVSSLLSVFPALTKVTLGMAHRSDKSVLLSSNNITELNIPNLEEISGFQPIANGVTGITKIAAPSLKNYDTRPDDKTNCICNNCPNVTEIDLRGLENVHHYSRNGGDANFAMIGNMQGLTKVQFGDIKTWTGSWTGFNNFIIGCPLLIDLRFKSVSCSLNLVYWSPTLDDSNLQQFLQNFRDYIALRLTDKGSGLTLTLSQEVRNAIHAAEATYGIENIIITQKGWTISPAPN